MHDLGRHRLDFSSLEKAQILEFSSLNGRTCKQEETKDDDETKHYKTTTDTDEEGKDDDDGEIRTVQRFSETAITYASRQRRGCDSYETGQIESGRKAVQEERKVKSCYLLLQRQKLYSGFRIISMTMRCRIGRQDRRRGIGVRECGDTS